MSSTNLHEAVKNLLRIEFQRERASDFALLRQIPSTGMRQFLHYFCNLDEQEKDALAEALAQNALTIFFPGEALGAYDSGNVAYKKYTTRVSIPDFSSPDWWKFEPVQELRMRLGMDSSKLWITDDVRKRIERIQPVKSTEIRKVVKLALSQTIAPLNITHNGGLWRYEGNLHGREISIKINYHQKYAQLNYGISHSDQNCQPSMLRIDLNYEGLMGISHLGWDCLEQTNLDRSIALLKQLIIRCSEFLQQLPNPSHR